MMIHFKGGVKFSKILVIKGGKLTDLDFVLGGGVQSFSNSSDGWGESEI